LSLIESFLFSLFSLLDEGKSTSILMLGRFVDLIVLVGTEPASV